MWVELCKYKGNAWHPLTRLLLVRWAGGASLRVREGRWRSLCTSAISMSVHKDRASRSCRVTAWGQLTAGREGETLEPGALCPGWRPAGDPLGMKRCLYLLVMESSSLSGLESQLCSLQSSLGLFLTQAGAGFPLLGCLLGLKVALESCLFSLLTNGIKNDLVS